MCSDSTQKKTKRILGVNYEQELGVNICVRARVRAQLCEFVRVLHRWLGYGYAPNLRGLAEDRVLCCTATNTPTASSTARCLSMHA